MKQVRVHIIGDVIGVGFRAWVKIKTKETGVKGWIRNVYNKPDLFGPHGGIEAVLQGEETSVADTIDFIREGSPISRVESVEVFEEAPTETLQEFSILKSEAYSHDS